MYTVYVYVLDTLADWELGHVASELNSGRFFKKGAPEVSLKTVASSKNLICTMGGLTLAPDCLVRDIPVDKTSVLLLPGATTWSEPGQNAILQKAGELLALGATVCAICGATAALANCGLLDERPHTSSGPGYLEGFAKNYKGQSYYIDEPSVADDNLITAGPTGALLWAKQIIQHLGVFQPGTLEFWYEYFHTGKPEAFFSLLQTLPPGGE